MKSYTQEIKIIQQQEKRETLKVFLSFLVVFLLYKYDPISFNTFTILEFVF